ncbi:uncharacterized protein LOC128958317 [Oppia nitens]|uniref:uncharacterized protein LOC128958317 n=1 Tax=Oppia nitens TaxID=1686743 RepID=UPI0023DC0C1D|nr:uncharacterized protein LOC128958317 [Oppia nitens]
MLAVWIAGGIYMSLPYRSTYREIDESMVKIRPTFLVTDSHNYGISAILTTEMMSIKKLLLIDEKSVSDLTSSFDIIEAIMLYERQYLPLPIDVSGNDTCALLSISSVDGSSRHVVRTNRNLIAGIESLENPESSALAVTDTVAVTGLYSSTGINFLLHALATGSTIAIYDKNDDTPDSTRLLDYINRYAITSTLLTTRQLDRCLANKSNVRSLMDVWFVGTAIGVNTHQKALKMFRQFRKVLNSPEVGWVTTEYLSEYRTNGNHKTIGRLVAGVELMVVDSNGRSEPHDIIGELCVRSYQCAPGYWRNEVESQQLVMSDGFVRTGEYGYYDRNGLFYIVGHKDQFVKVDDFMISTEELESILLTHLTVGEAIVICAEDDNGCEYPKAYVSINPNYKHTGAAVAEEQSLENQLREFVNIRIDPRKRLSIDYQSVEMINGEIPTQSHNIKRLSLKKELETFL